MKVTTFMSAEKSFGQNQIPNFIAAEMAVDF